MDINYLIFLQIKFCNVSEVNEFLPGCVLLQTYVPYITHPLSLPDSVNGVDFNILVKLHTPATPKNDHYFLKPKPPCRNHRFDIGVTVTDKKQQLARLGATKKSLYQSEKKKGISETKMPKVCAI